MLRLLRRGKLVRGLPIASILLAISCGGGSSCGGTSCGGCGDSGYRFPLNDPNRPDAVVQKEAARARITQRFLDFIRPQLPAVIRANLASANGLRVDADGVLHIPLPDREFFDIGVAEAKMRESEALIWLDDLDQRLDIQFEAPNYVRLTLTNLRLGIAIKLKEDAAGTTSSCPIEGDLGPLGPGPLKHAAEISVNARIDPGVGPDPERDLDIKVTVDDVELDELDITAAGSSAYCAESECQDCVLEAFGSCLDPGGRCAECHVFCGGVTDGLLNLASALIDLLRPLLSSILRPVVEDLLGSTLNDLNGSSAKIETEVSLGALTGIGAFARSNPFGIFVAPEPGRFPVLDRGTGLGMEITASGGAEGRLADCVGELADFVPIKGPPPVLGGTDSQNRPYHIGFTLASSLLNEFFYAMHRSGSLCIKLTTEDVRQLTKGRFTLNASLLSLLAADIAKLTTDRAPVILELKPRNAPRVELGTGAVVGQDSMGNDLYDWLLKLSIDELGIAFHVLMQDRYVRIFEVTSDIFVGTNITVLPDNSLEIAVGELRIDDFNERFNEILPNANFAMVLPTLIEIATQGLLSNTLTFDADLASAVSDALNGAPVYMRVNDIFRDGAQQDYLTMTLTFTSSPPGGPLSIAAETRASLHENDGLIERIDGVARATGSVRLALGAEPVTTQRVHDLEYQVRVDGGLWRVPRKPLSDGTLVVEDAHLLLPGAHEIEVRARYDGDYRSLDPTPVKLSAIVDPIPPSLKAWMSEGAIEVLVTDPETPPHQIPTLEARFDRAPWTVVTLAPGNRERGAPEAAGWTALIPFAALGGASRVELRAFDPHGNTSPIASLALDLAASPVLSGPEAGGCGCGAIESPRRPKEGVFGSSGILPMPALLGLLALHLWSRASRARS